jgi:hypothetical protein
MDPSQKKRKLFDDDDEEEEQLGKYCFPDHK